MPLVIKLKANVKNVGADQARRFNVILRPKDSVKNFFKKVASQENIGVSQLKLTPQMKFHTTLEAANVAYGQQFDFMVYPTVPIFIKTLIGKSTQIDISLAATID